MRRVQLVVRQRWVPIVVLAAIVPAKATVAQDSLPPLVPHEAVRLATQAAQTWLRLLDEGDYVASWELAAEAFRKAVTKSAWELQVVAARRPFEPFDERTVLRAEYTTSLPNAPPGEYVVLEYQTQVANGSTAVETVVPMREADGTWRVSGYFVRAG